MGFPIVDIGSMQNNRMLQKNLVLYCNKHKSRVEALKQPPGFQIIAQPSLKC